jgi:hypothetical protein
VDGNLLTSNDGGASWQLLDEHQLPELWNKTNTLGSNTILYNSPAGVQRLYNQLPYVRIIFFQVPVFVTENAISVRSMLPAWMVECGYHQTMVQHGN